MADDMPLDRAYLVAIWLETLMFGMNACIFWAYIYVDRFRRVRRLSPIIFSTITVMFLLSAAHVALGFTRLIWGFIDHRDASGGPTAFFLDISTRPYVARAAIRTVNAFLGDLIILWRCWNIWEFKCNICILPAVMILGSAVAGFGQVAMFSENKDTYTAFATSLARWSDAFFSLSFATNVILTALIASRVWFITRDSSGNVLAGVKYRFMKISTLVVESALVYTVGLFLETVLYFAHSNGFYIVHDAVVQLTSMVPTTILIVTTLGLTASDFSPESTLRLAARDAHGSSSLHFASAFSAAASRAPADDEETVLDISKARRGSGSELSASTRGMGTGMCEGEGEGHGYGARARARASGVWDPSVPPPSPPPPPLLT